MDAKTMMTLGFTFLVGCFSGAYLYVTVFAPQYVGDGFEDPSEITFRVQGQAYGGCFRNGSTCPLFTLEENRRYTYRQPAAPNTEPMEVTGRMSREDFATLQELVANANPDRLSRETGRNCDSYVDGVDYRYNIVVEGESFELDTCGTAFQGSALERALRPLWTEFKTPKEPLSWWPEGGLRALAHDQIDSWFQYDGK